MQQKQNNDYDYELLIDHTIISRANHRKLSKEGKERSVIANCPNAVVKQMTAYFKLQKFIQFEFQYKLENYDAALDLISDFYNLLGNFSIWLEKKIKHAKKVQDKLQSGLQIYEFFKYLSHLMKIQALDIIGESVIALEEIEKIELELNDIQNDNLRIFVNTRAKLKKIEIQLKLGPQNHAQWISWFQKGVMEEFLKVKDQRLRDDKTQKRRFFINELRLNQKAQKFDISRSKTKKNKKMLIIQFDSNFARYLFKSLTLTYFLNGRVKHKILKFVHQGNDTRTIDRRYAIFAYEVKDKFLAQFCIEKKRRDLNKRFCYLLNPYEGLALKKPAYDQIPKIKYENDEADIDQLIQDNFP
ncbi:UNKNOWN [Stylonychia lemnae]|uniref:Uncharacterized protein n=1 Tax=Stylonychia lemnae TaxID=5949 RepID=A0A078B923_STYLE|nr:UNKNOWN [Stylonychia lemnae]|eukprot:CDW91015.1 UNKNOWN [Stylonychia lemnae]